MSDTPNPEEIVKISRLRPAEDDAQDAVPKKVFKGDSGSDEDDIVALDSGDEADFDLTEDDDLDGKEDPYDENTHSSIDLDEAAQASLAFIEDCQSDIDKLNQKANDEILRVEQKYNKLRQPVYTRRSNYINRVPHFWATVFARHSQLKRVLNKEDLRCLDHLTNLQIFDFEDSRSGYQIIFHFSQNPWFSNATITKEYHLPWHDSPSCDCTAIEWKPGMNLTSKSSSFFSWFCSQEDSSTDDIAEIIKEELWPNPLQSYLVKDNIEESGSDESDLDSNDEEPVYITDDPAEYISSGDDDYTSPPVQGKVAPGGSKEDPYVIDDNDDEQYEEFDEESSETPFQSESKITPVDDDHLLDDVIENDVTNDDDDDIIENDDDDDDVINEVMNDDTNEDDEVIENNDDVIENDLINEDNESNNATTNNGMTSSHSAKNQGQTVTSSVDDVISKKQISSEINENSEVSSSGDPET